MAQSDIERVSTIFAGISAGDVDLATRFIDGKRFVQHNPYAADGLEGLIHFISQSTRGQLQLTIVRALQDGPYVVTQARGKRSGRNIFFDIFRFADGLVVEHWAFSTQDARPTKAVTHRPMGRLNRSTWKRRKRTNHSCADITKPFISRATTVRASSTSPAI